MSRGINFAFLMVVAVAACVGDDPNTTAATGGTSSSGGNTGSNLVDNGGAENGCIGPVFTSNHDLETFTAAVRTGGKACKVCRITGDEPSLYLFAKVDVAPKKGEVYEVSAWLRKAPGVENNGNSQISIIGIGPDESAMPDNQAPANGPSIITDEWKEAKTTWTVSQDGAEHMRIDLGLPAADQGACFLVDDVSVIKR